MTAWRNSLTATVNPVTGGIELSAGGVPVPKATKVWRGIGQAMSVAVQGLATGVNWSVTHRTRHYSNVRFRRVRAVLQTFYPTGTPIADTNFADNYNFQVGFEANYANALTGIAPRKMFTFSGAETAQYLAASPPVSGYILSDILDLGGHVEAKDFFGLWTTVEATSQAANKIPYTKLGSNFINKYVGSIGNTSSNVAAQSAKLASSITATTSTQGGSASYFTPVMLLIETDSNLPFVVHLSDSIGYGVGEGVGGSGANGDSLGSALGNSGIIDRAIYENLGFSSVNLGKGSDRNSYLSTAANWQYRAELLKLANPTHVINANIHNDMTLSDAVVWAATTAFSEGAVITSSSSNYVCVKGGVSGAVTPAGTSGGIVDGTCIWAYIAPYPANPSLSRPTYSTVGHMLKVSNIIKQLVPGVPVIGMLPTPDATTTDQYATDANQTPASGWGDTTSRRYLIGEFMKTGSPLLGFSGYFDPSSVLESQFPTVTSKWVANGSASYVTWDGTHPNSTGYALAASALTADKFR